MDGLPKADSCQRSGEMDENKKEGLADSYRESGKVDEEEEKTLGTELIDTLDDCIVRIYRGMVDTHKFASDVCTDEEFSDLWNTIRQLVMAVAAAQANYGLSPRHTQEWAVEAERYLDKLSDLKEYLNEEDKK
jgi:hypothetical protein